MANKKPYMIECRMLTDSLHEKMKTQFLYTSSCSQGWLWKLLWQVLFPGCLSSWRDYIVMSDSFEQKKLSVSTPQQVELTTPTEWEHSESLWTSVPQFIKIQYVTLEPKWLLRTWHLNQEFSLDLSLHTHKIYAPPQTLWDFKVVLHGMTKIQSLYNDCKP